MKTKKISAILLATTLSFAGISYAVAGNHQGMRNNQDCQNQSGEMKRGKHRGNNHQKMAFSQLDLTAEQKQQMQEIMNTVRTENRSNRDEGKPAYRAEMQTIMNNETFDETKAKALIDTQQIQKAEKRLATMKAKHQMFQLLTDEQKTQYSELRTQRNNR